MSELPHRADPMDELRAALSEGDAESPPHELGPLVLAAALVARPPGRSSQDLPAITPVEGFVRSVEALDSLLDSLGEAEWHLPALRDLDVQGLLGHLIGVERDFLAALDDPAGPQAEADHVGFTDPVAHEQSGQSPNETLMDWRRATARSLEHLTAVPVGPELLERPLALHGIHLPLGPLLIVRTFELWTHQEDIRRATGRELEAPDGPTLRLMTDLAFELLPRALERAPRSPDAGSTRVVLTGPGGRTWQEPPRSTSPTAPGSGAAVRIVMDATQFCRLVANRLDPMRVEATITGEESLARELFVVAAGLALD